MAKELDYMEYSTPALAQAAYVSSDAWDTYTKLMLHCDGTDGSTTFTDEIGKTVTANGNAQIDTAQSKFGGASGLFDGTGDYLSIPDSDDWNFGSGDFTIDFHVMFNSLDALAAAIRFFVQRDGADYKFNLTLYNDAGVHSVFFYVVNAQPPIFNNIFHFTNNMIVNTWYHIALVRSGNNFYVFKDEVQQDSTYTQAGTCPDFTTDLKIGVNDAEAGTFDGWLDEYRVSKGIARWTANFTPPTLPYPNLQCYSESTIKQQGSYSLKGLAWATDSLNDTLTRTVSPTIDLTGRTQIKYWARALRTGSNFKIGWRDSGLNVIEHTPNIIQSNTWEEQAVNISGVSNANKDAIDRIIFTVLDATSANIVYLDNMYGLFAGQVIFISD